MFVCRWRETDRGYEAWVKARPGVRVTAPTFAKADEALAELIGQRYGEIENERSYDTEPPRPATDGYAVSESVACLFGNWVPMVPEDMGRFTVGGMCPRCRTPRGARNRRGLELENVPSSDLMLLTVSSGELQRQFPVCSAAFLDLLTPSERRGLAVRRVRRARGRQVMEITGSRHHAEYRAIRGVPEQPLRCNTCRRTTQPVGVGGEHGYRLFVRRTDLPKTVPSIFTVGHEGSIDICMRWDRWREIAGRRGARGVTVSRVGLVADAHVITRRKCASLATEGPKREARQRADSDEFMRLWKAAERRVAREDAGLPVDEAWWSGLDARMAKLRQRC